MKRQQAKALGRILGKIELPRDSKIIDVGCGSGSILAIFRNLGYFNSIGIDVSSHGLKLCSQLFGFEEGKDIFSMDARNIEFPDNFFDLVFSDGLLEHFAKPPLEIVSELCRLSRKWILLFQPNQSSLFGRAKWLWQKIGRASWEKEHYYSRSDYVNMLAEFGFGLVASGSINLQEAIWLLFSKGRLSASESS